MARSKLEVSVGNAPTKGGFADRSVHLLGQRPILDIAFVVLQRIEKGSQRDLHPFRDRHRVEMQLIHHGQHLNGNTGFPAGYRALFCGLKDRFVVFI